MKIGMIFECGPEGADKKVCEYLARHIRANCETSPIALDNKPKLLREAGTVAKQLLADGCCCVLIIWDLRPPWPNNRSGSRVSECALVLQSLCAAGVAATAPVHLICIEQELESWLLANEHAISAYLSTSAHPYSVARAKKPDQVKQPKARMIRHFKSARGRRYDDKVDAIRVLRAVTIDLNPNAPLGELRQIRAETACVLK